MTRSTTERMALEELDSCLRTWFSQNNAAYNMKPSTPIGQTVTYANIHLSDARGVINKLTSSSSETRVQEQLVKKHLRKKYDYVTTVTIEAESSEITILISRDAFAS